MRKQKIIQDQTQEFIDYYVKYVFQRPTFYADPEEKRELLCTLIDGDNQHIIFDMRKWYVTYNHSLDGFKNVLQALKKEEMDTDAALAQERTEIEKKGISEIKEGKHDDAVYRYYQMYVLHKSYPFETLDSRLSGIMGSFGEYWKPDSDNRKNIQKVVLQRGDILHKKKEEEERLEREAKQNARIEEKKKKYEEIREEEKKAEERRTWWRK